MNSGDGQSIFCNYDAHSTIIRQSSDMSTLHMYSKDEVQNVNSAPQTGK